MGHEIKISANIMANTYLIHLFRVRQGLKIMYAYSSSAINLLEFYPFNTLLGNTITPLSLPVNCCCICDQNHKETHFYGDGIAVFQVSNHKCYFD